VDESETGSANFFGPARSACPRSGPGEGVFGKPGGFPKVFVGRQGYDRVVHLRLPSIDPGVRAFVWALVFSLYIFGGLLAIGIDKATSLVLGLLSFAGIFLYVRLYGVDQRV
jgi:hypothetical protein